MNEFELIRRYFQRPQLPSWCVLGIGDDAALIRPQPGEELLLCSDTLVAGRHFPVATDAEAIGWKSLAVNLSDLAAMGGQAQGFLLNLNLPEASADFLEPFARGLFALADQHGVALVGGDTTRGPLSISITAFGTVPHGQAIRRAGARVGDVIVAGGVVGAAALALHEGAAASPALRRALDYPQPQLALGQALRGLAHAAIDISDGLAADLSHLLQASGVGAKLHLDQLPLAPALRALEPPQARRLALGGGDDYVLCFTLPRAAYAALRAKFPDLPAPFGEITARRGLYAECPDGKLEPLSVPGYQHFE